MTTPHRATPEQWAMLEEQSAPEYDSTILELRSRIEALEATQHAPTTERPPGGLVKGLAKALADQLQPSGTWNHEARAAIREVAAWLRAGHMLHAADLLEQEADR
jgi:hypothetical protein